MKVLYLNMVAQILVYLGPPLLFSNLTDDCHPIATKPREYSRDELAFVGSELKRLLKEGIIEHSKSPWWAQVVVMKSDIRKYISHRLLISLQSEMLFCEVMLPVTNSRTVVLYIG